MNYSVYRVWNGMFVPSLRLSQFRQPIRSECIHRNDRILFRQDEYSRPIRCGYCRNMSQEQGFAQTFGDVRSELSEERCLGSRILRSTSFPVQAQGSPTGSIRDKDGTHLISQSQWLEDVSITFANMEVILGLVPEYPNRQTI